MPLAETVSILAALANAYQIMRGSRTTEDTASASASASIQPNELLAYEFAKAATDGSIELLDSIRSRMQGLVICSGLLMIGGALIVRAADRNPNLDSALFLVGLTALVAIAVLGTLARSLPSPFRSNLIGNYESNGSEADFLLRMLKETHEKYADNCRRISFYNIVLMLLSLLFMIQVIALATWIPLDH